jgi:hypothetical protein
MSDHHRQKYTMELNENLLNKVEMIDHILELKI